MQKKFFPIFVGILLIAILYAIVASLILNMIAVGDIKDVVANMIEESNKVHAKQVAIATADDEATKAALEEEIDGIVEAFLNTNTVPREPMMFAGADVNYRGMATGVFNAFAQGHIDSHEVEILRRRERVAALIRVQMDGTFAKSLWDALADRIKEVGYAQVIAAKGDGGWEDVIEKNAETPLHPYGTVSHRTYYMIVVNSRDRFNEARWIPILNMGDEQGFYTALTSTWGDILFADEEEDPFGGTSDSRANLKYDPSLEAQFELGMRLGFAVEMADYQNGDAGETLMRPVVLHPLSAVAGAKADELEAEGRMVKANATDTGFTLADDGAVTLNLIPPVMMSEPVTYQPFGSWASFRAVSAIFANHLMATVAEVRSAKQAVLEPLNVAFGTHYAQWGDIKNELRMTLRADDMKLLEAATTATEAQGLTAPSSDEVDSTIEAFIEKVGGLTGTPVKAMHDAFTAAVIAGEDDDAVYEAILAECVAALRALPTQEADAVNAKVTEFLITLSGGKVTEVPEVFAETQPRVASAAQSHLAAACERLSAFLQAFQPDRRAALMMLRNMDSAYGIGLTDPELESLFEIVSMEDPQAMLPSTYAAESNLYAEGDPFKDYVTRNFAAGTMRLRFRLEDRKEPDTVNPRSGMDLELDFLGRLDASFGTRITSINSSLNDLRVFFSDVEESGNIVKYVRDDHADLLESLYRREGTQIRPSHMGAYTTEIRRQIVNPILNFLNAPAPALEERFADDSAGLDLLMKRLATEIWERYEGDKTPGGFDPADFRDWAQAEIPIAEGSETKHTRLNVILSGYLGQRDAFIEWAVGAQGGPSGNMLVPTPPRDPVTELFPTENATPTSEALLAERTAWAEALYDDMFAGFAEAWLGYLVWRGQHNGFEADEDLRYTDPDAEPLDDDTLPLLWDPNLEDFPQFYWQMDMLVVQTVTMGAGPEDGPKVSWKPVRECTVRDTWLMRIWAAQALPNRQAALAKQDALEKAAEADDAAALETAEEMAPHWLGPESTDQDDEDVDDGPQPQTQSSSPE